jgi:hypothetical protein
MVQNDETTALLSPARNGNGAVHTAIDLGEVVPIVAPYTPTSPTLKLPNEDLKAVHRSYNDVEPEPDFICVCMLTVLIGLVNSRSVVRRSPLEILREEV